ncbi:cell division protein FtsL [Lapidilactobacillus luobeiensis]|uniref:cell division protein FtsL n=1 Tax=Lapidilactobacillus luobeiensis TaxID=2950371 RepID=UPI0021C2B395|nr:cell division protein FtsL [Lapidilactobacillus luobeiensis]
MNDNTVKKLQPEVMPSATPTIETPVSAPESSHKVRFSILERLLAVCACAAVLSLMIFLVHTSVGIASNQRQLQDIQTKISQVKTSSVDLQQEIGELGSSDRLAAYAKKNGLSFNDANVRNMTK